MLVITRKDGEAIDFMVNGVRGRIVLHIDRGRARMVFDAPRDFQVLRSELTPHDSRFANVATTDGDAGTDATAASEGARSN